MFLADNILWGAYITKLLVVLTYLWISVLVCFLGSILEWLFVFYSSQFCFIETTVEVLPRLCQIKYASGTLEELLYVDMPRESQNASGQIVLDYAKAIQESVFEQLRVVRDGQLRIVFNPDLKVKHEKMVVLQSRCLLSWPRNLLDRFTFFMLFS